MQNKEYQMFLSYMENERLYPNSTIIVYSSYIRNFLLFIKQYFKIESVSQVKEEHAKAWNLYLYNNKYSSSNISSKIIIIRSYFNFFITRKKIEKNPISVLKIPKVQRKPIHTIPVEKMKTLLNKVIIGKDYKSILERTIMEILYHTGIRRTELANIKNKDINFEKEVIKITGKGNKQRLVPIGDKLMKSLSKYIEIRDKNFKENKHDFLLISLQGSPVRNYTIANIAKRYISLLGPNYSAHTHITRHTFATHLLNNGADIHVVKRLLGHSKIKTTQKYINNSIDEIKEIYFKAHPRVKIKIDEKLDQQINEEFHIKTIPS